MSILNSMIVIDDFDSQIQIEELIPEGYEDWIETMNYKVGDKIHIDYMKDEPNYEGREGIIRSIDDMGQIHGSWGGLALIPGEDSFRKIED